MWAEQLSQRRLQIDGKATSVDALIHSFGWTVRMERLGAASNGHRAMLLPLLTGGFVIVVDPEVWPGDQRSWMAEQRFRLAHELAHTLFYAPGEPPRRLTAGSLDEETFCDCVADHILELFG